MMVGANALVRYAESLKLDSGARMRQEFLLSQCAVHHQLVVEGDNFIAYLRCRPEDLVLVDDNDLDGFLSLGDRLATGPLLIVVGMQSLDRGWGLREFLKLRRIPGVRAIAGQRFKYNQAWRAKLTRQLAGNEVQHAAA